MKYFVLLCLLIGCSAPPSERVRETASEQQTAPTISFTFDDGVTRDLVGYDFKDWNEMILAALDAHSLKATFFVTAGNKLDRKGKYLLKSWDERGHQIANHTFSHPNYNDPNVSFEDFKEEFLQAKEVVQQYENYVPLFRFPYLKEGNTEEKVNSFRSFLETQNYHNGYVTIDNSDWYINSRLLKRLKEQPNADIEAYRIYYLEHISSCATHYETMAYELTGRHIPHTLLLHHNLTSALFLDDLIAHFKEKGWKITDANLAFQDSIFQNIPSDLFAGESLIWAMAKSNGDTLRYPAEGSRYEEAKIDSLGL
ncbi:MAG: polysaccharide deacetylase family protein [Bacteroidota bacterium]